MASSAISTASQTSQAPPTSQVSVSRPSAVLPPSAVSAGLPLALLFPGQGVQRPGMGAPWRETASWAELVGDLSEWSGCDIEHLLLDADADELRRTDLAQTAVFALCVIAYREFARCHPDAVVRGFAGHSLGEFAALAAAGALSLSDAAALVAARGRAMLHAAQEEPGTMAVIVQADRDALEEVLSEARARGERIWTANINAPGQIVVSGAVEDVDRLADAAPSFGAKAIRIPVGGAFHSPLMASAATALTRALGTVEFAAEHTPVVANVDAQPHARGADWPALAVRQLTGRVLWSDSMRTLTGPLSCAALVELGPGGTLARLATRVSPGFPVTSLDVPNAVAALGSGA